MRLAVSVIAWSADEDAEALDRLAGSVDGLEAAPTRLWGDWDAATPEVAARWREHLEQRGLEAPALQSLMFGVQDASITGDAGQRRRAAEHLCRVGAIAGALGARVAVFGSPGARRRGELTHKEATGRAREALLPAAEAFAAHGAALGIEANPPDYGCDFITTYAEAAEFVAAVDHPGVTRHLDAGQLRLSDEWPDVAAHPPAHVHLSAPHLVPFRAEPRDWHERLLAELQATGYAGWVSIEERPEPTGLAGVAQAAGAARALLATA